MMLKKRFISVMLSLCLALGSLPAQLSASAENEYETTLVSAVSEENGGKYELPQGSVEVMPNEAFTAPALLGDIAIPPSFNGLSLTSSPTLMSKIVSPYVRQSLDNYTNGSKMKAFFDYMNTYFEQVWYGDDDLASRYNITYTSFGLSQMEAKCTFVALRDAQPMLLFTYALGGSSSGYIYTTVRNEYVGMTAAQRRAADKRIQAYIDLYSGAAQKTTRYDKALFIHDKIINMSDYAFKPGTTTPQSEDWAHTIIGIVDKNSAVCEGYSRAYEMLVNYYGGDCAYAHGTGNGGGHAWNVVKMDDNRYYYVDTTWDDPVTGIPDKPGNYLKHDYFAVGTESFYKKHTPSDSSTGVRSPDEYDNPWNFHYKLPDIPKSNYEKAASSCTHSYTLTTVRPDCTQQGYTLHLCIKCGDSYKTDIKNPLGHSYGEPVWSWSQDRSSASADFTCSVCHLKTTVKANMISSSKTTNSCTKPGTATYTASLSFGSQKYTNTISEYIAAGHKYGSWINSGFDIAKGTRLRTRTCTVCGARETQGIANAVKRYSGKGRYETAAAISQAAYPQKADTVVLANGMTFADALAGVALADVNKAPILLTGEDTLDPAAVSEIKRLNAKNIIILGGEGAVSGSIEKQLADMGLNVSRAAGKTRFGTAVSIAEKVNPAPKDIFLVYGMNFADALSASTVAAIKKAPMLYLTTDGELNSDTAAYLAKLKALNCVENVYFIGGTGVISEAMVKKVHKALGIGFSARVAGQNRYSTCVQVNSIFASELSGKTICIAKGSDFPDALSGGVLAAQRSAPLFLADGSLNSEQTSYLKNKKAENLCIFGGTGAVPDSLASAIGKACA
ncbi:MAG: cell wall-binding repeat-containing protein [Ruminococcus sp.]|nr:cell wall-binding repeat-containing protein [Ruminococcus sp.]